MFTKRTIKPERRVTSVDTPSEALAISIGERGKVDLPFMAQLLGTPGEYDAIQAELRGVIFKDPMAPDAVEVGWQTADDYLSGDVRSKLRVAQMAADRDSSFHINVEALQKAQPKDLDASEIDVRLGATWIDADYIQQFMEETFETPYYLRRSIEVKFSELTAEWRINGKSSPNYNDVAAYVTYGTERANAYRILEETLNLKDIRIYDTIEDADGKQKRVLNKKETTLAQQKQQAIKDAFRDWIWRDPHRRETLSTKYNELFNSTRPREYDGSHIRFGGMNPDITLREHHRRKHAAEKLGYRKVLVIIRVLSEDDSILSMVDSNLHRERISYSEKAFAYKMKQEAMKHQGSRTDLTLGQNVPKFKRTTEAIADGTGESYKQIQRYIRLTELLPELLDLLDNKKLQFTVAVNISYIDKEIQGWIYEYISDTGFIKPKQIAALRNQLNDGPINQIQMLSIFNNCVMAKKVSRSLTFSEKKLTKYFPDDYTAKDMEQVIESLLEKWMQEQSC